MLVAHLNLDCENGIIVM